MATEGGETGEFKMELSNNAMHGNCRRFRYCFCWSHCRRHGVNFTTFVLIATEVDVARGLQKIVMQPIMN